MEYSRDLVWSYCTNPGVGRSKDEIFAIVESRAMSLLQRSKFQNLLKQMETIMDKCIDCRILAQTLLLLQELLPKAKPEIALVWNANPERNLSYKNFFAHEKKGQKLRSCTMCHSVQSSSDYLERELGSTGPTPRESTRGNNSKEKRDEKRVEADEDQTRDLFLNCVLCRSIDIKRIVLSCGHPICRACGLKAIEKIKSSPESNHFICPVDRNLCGLASLETKLGKVVENHQNNFKPPPEEKSHRQRSRTTFSTSSSSSKDDLETIYRQTKDEVVCPRCKAIVYLNSSHEKLAECLSCKDCFCSKCFKPFHGNTTDCSTTSETKGMGIEKTKKVSTSSSSSSNANTMDRNHEESGASAKQYEIDFYKDSSHDLFRPNEIQAAFQTVSESQFVAARVSEWPWEIGSVGLTPSLQYPAQYESLRVGHWVEDEILERVMQIMLHQNQLQEVVVILESFIMTWGLRKSQGADELARILQEKQIFEKDLAFVLINSDAKGHGGHWILGVIIIPKQKILLLDSALILSTTHYQKYFFGLLNILHIAHKVQECNNKGVFDPSQWKLYVSLDAIQQNNAYDCGPCVVCNAFSLATRGTQLDRRPKSFLVREWLYHTLVNFNEKQDDKRAGTRSAGGVTELLPHKNSTFAPSGLIIKFKFFQNSKLA